MTAQAPQNLATNLAKTTVTFSAVAATDTIVVNAGYQYVLIVVNANASPDSVVITPNQVDAWGRAVAVSTISVTNATTAYIYLPNQPGLADGTTGLITITHSVTSSVTCGIIAIPRA